MEQQRNTLPDEVYLRDYLLLIIRHWWLIIVVVAIVLVATWLTAPSIPLPAYETNAKLLLVQSTSDSLNGGQSPGMLLFTTPDAVRSLAVSSDLLSEIVSRADLRAAVNGPAWPVTRLKNMLVVTVEQGGRDASPIINLTVRGDDPGQIKKIADTWAEVFTEQNGILFSTEAGRSYDFAADQFLKAESALEASERDVQLHTEEFTLSVLKDELTLKENDLRGYLDIYLDTSAKLELRTEQYRDVLSHLDELSLNGKWIGLHLNGEVPEGYPDQTLEQRAVLQAKRHLFEFQEEVQEFNSRAGTALLEQRLELEKEQLAEYKRLLVQANTEAETQAVVLESLESEMDGQDQYLVTVRALNDASLWQLLGADPTVEDWEAVRKLGLKSEVVNPVFVALATEIITTRATAISQREFVAFLEEEILASQAIIQTLDDEITRNRNVALARFAVEGELIQNRYDREQSNYLNLQDKAIQLRNEIRDLQTLKDQHALLVESYTEDVETLVIQIPRIESQLQKFNNGLQASQSDLNDWRNRLRDAEVARAEGSNNILTLESAIEPTEPIARSNALLPRLAIGSVLGVILGVVAAFMFSYMRGVNWPEEET